MKNFLIFDVLELSKDVLFKGNMNIEKLEGVFVKCREKILFVMIIIINNMVGGEFVSMENIKVVFKLCWLYGILLFFDVCCFVENVWFIKIKEEGYVNCMFKEIVWEIFFYGDGCIMLVKKDGLVNIGGFLVVNDGEFVLKCCKEFLIIEGFMIYGGLVGCDLEVIVVGLNEVVEEDYLCY